MFTAPISTGLQNVLANEKDVRLTFWFGRGKVSFCFGINDK